MSTQNVRRAVSLVLRDAEAPIPSDHVALVLLALDSLYLLRDLDEDPEAYVVRVREASRAALQEVMRRQRLRVVESPDSAHEG